ncbi:hypothetical protein CSA37_00240 [Candidatus Fermentibacteria bacterium]|nr:MAG: hypothetical protein CSA37_00240 [Candidatus Fermentibacteria bacterium]
MHRILGGLALTAFIIEEIFHRKRQRKNRLPAEPSYKQSNSMDIFDVLRLIEILLLAMILSTEGGRPQEPSGQMSIILIGLQVFRLFGRKILNRWSVLGILQALQVILLLIVILIPLRSSADYVSIGPAEVLSLAGGIAYGILLTLCASFSTAYWIKLYSREFSGTYETFPPLADSERWARRFAILSLYAGFTASAAMFVQYGAVALPFFFTGSALLTTAGIIAESRESFTGHHRKAHLLWSLSFLLTLSIFIAGITASSVH